MLKVLNKFWILGMFFMANTDSGLIRKKNL
jgi:hypothetical protein